MAKIESLPGKHWSPAAAIANLMENVDDIDEVLIIYTSKENGVQYSQAANITTKDALWMLEVEKTRIITKNLLNCVE